MWRVTEKVVHPNRGWAEVKRLSPQVHFSTQIRPIYVDIALFHYFRIMCIQTHWYSIIKGEFFLCTYGAVYNPNLVTDNIPGQYGAPFQKAWRIIKLAIIRGYALNQPTLTLFIMETSEYLFFPSQSWCRPVVLHDPSEWVFSDSG